MLCFFIFFFFFFFFSSRRRHTRYIGDWSSDVCSSDLFGLLDTTQVEARTAVRLSLRHPLRDVFLGFSFEVLAQLVVQFLVRLRPAKQRPQPQWNRVQPMLRSHSPALPHSYLKATIGSTFIARRAGK